MFNIINFSVRILQCPKLLQTVTLRATIQRKRTGWMHRKPIAIVNEEELFEDEDVNTKQRESREPRNRIKAASRTQTKRIQNVQMEKPTVTTKFGLTYTSLTEKDRFLSSTMIKVKSRKQRSKVQRILLEGYRLIGDGIEAGAVPKIIFFSRISDVEKLPKLSNDVELYKVPYRALQLWSNLTTSPGLIGIFEMPQVENIVPAPDTLPLTIICDNIREPGSLGAILRAAAGVGCEKLILMKGCVDLWEPKVLRSASGAHFRLPIYTSQLWENINSHIDNASHVYIADNNIFFNESSDLKEDLGSDAEHHDIHINEFHDDESNNIRVVDTVLDEVCNTQEGQTKSNKQQNLQIAIKKAATRKLLSELPIIPYYSTDYTQNEVVLVVGGETEGFSIDSMHVLREKQGVRINIPLTNRIESLNVGMAVSVIAFEMKRQLLAKQSELQ